MKPLNERLPDAELSLHRRPAIDDAWDRLLSQIKCRPDTSDIIVKVIVRVFGDGTHYVIREDAYSGSEHYRTAEITNNVAAEFSARPFFGPHGPMVLDGFAALSVALRRDAERLATSLALPGLDPR